METREIKIEPFALKLARTPVVHLAEVEKHLLAKTANTGEGRRAIVAAIFQGIRRARKECEACGGITLDWLEESIDGDNGPALFRTFFELNGFTPKKNGDASPGEAQAAEAPPQS